MICDSTSSKPRRPRMWVRVMIALVVSVGLHVLAYGWLVFYPLFISIADVQIIDRPYEPFPGKLVGRLIAPPPPLRETMRAPQRIPNRVREEERQAQKKDPNANQAQEASQRSEAQPISPEAFTAINLAPLRDGVTDIIDALKKAGLLEKPADFSIQVGFRFLKDGRLSNMEISQSSGNGVIDHQALVALWAISESRAAAPISSLRNGQIRLRVRPESTEIEIFGFAYASQDAKILGESLKVLLFSATLIMNSNTDWRDILGAMRIDVEDNVIIFRTMAESNLLDRVIQKNMHYFQKRSPIVPPTDPQ